MKYFRYILLAMVAVLAIIGLLSVSQVWQRWMQPKTEVSATVLLERIEKVVKLTTVEGNFSEIYNYKNHVVADIWPLRKKALVRITATVAVGYDFESIEIDIDQDNRMITLSNFPPPQILSIQHDIDYYNFENGLFNMINNKDITDMGIEAKSFIEQKARESDLFDRAESQRVELLDMMGMAMDASGWTLKYDKAAHKD